MQPPSGFNDINEEMKAFNPMASSSRPKVANSPVNGGGKASNFQPAYDNGQMAD